METDGTNHVLAGRGQIHAYAIPVQGADYRFRPKVKLISGSLNLNIRDRNCHRYALEFTATGMTLRRGACSSTDLNPFSEVHQFNTWYTVDVMAMVSFLPAMQVRRRNHSPIW